MAAGGPDVPIIVNKLAHFSGPARKREKRIVFTRSGSSADEAAQVLLGPSEYAPGHAKVIVHIGII